MPKEIKVHKPVRISVIIPVLNEEEHIERVIRKVRERSSYGAEPEIIVADGGSRDQTAEIAERAGARVVYCSRTGRAVQMNIGASAARGDLLYFLHADTIPPHGYTHEIIHAINKGAQSGCFQLRFDGEHPLLRFYSWCTRFNTTLVRFGDQSLFVEAKLFQNIGGFDEHLTVMEDQEIVRRLKNSGSFMLIGKQVKTSARKYKKNGVIRLQLLFTIILVLYYFGVQQDTLIHLYRSLIRG